MSIVPLTFGFVLFLAPLVGAVWLLRTVVQGLGVGVTITGILWRAVFPGGTPPQFKQIMKLALAFCIWLACCFTGPLLLVGVPFVWGNPGAVAVVGLIGLILTLIAVVPPVIIGRRLLRVARAAHLHRRVLPAAHALWATGGTRSPQRPQGRRTRPRTPLVTRQDAPVRPS